MQKLHPTLILLREHDYDSSGVTRQTAIEIEELDGPDLWDLFAIANRVRHEQVGDVVELCGIVNAQSGHCPEDCAFCSQSRHFGTGIETWPYLSSEQIVASADTAVAHGASRFGIVTATRDLRSGEQLDVVLESVRAAAADGRLQVDASLGIIDEPEVAVALREAGLVELNHNLETSRAFFPKVCTTHDYQARVDTIRHAKRAGLKVCSGGVFGMGETWSDRVDLAFELDALEVDTVPLNFLHRIDGTPLSDCTPIAPMEILRIVAMFRLVLPRTELKVAGGREVNLRSLQPLMFAAGASSTMVGNYLTTGGWDHEKDHEMIRDLGLRIGSSC